MKKSYILIMIIVSILLIQPIVSANVIKNDKKFNEENEALHTNSDIVVDMGKMKIIGDDRSIELNKDVVENNRALVKDVDLDDVDRIVKFVVHYEFKEGALSVDKDEWYFELRLYDMGGPAPSKLIDTREFKDTSGKTDEGEGELCVYTSLREIWTQRVNHGPRIYLKLIHREDPLVGSPYSHTKKKDLRVISELPDYHIELIPNDGTNFGEVKIGQSKTKRFTIKNVNPYQIHGEVLIVGEDSDRFTISQSNDDWYSFYKIDGLESIPVDITFTPKEEKTYEVKLKVRANDVGYNSYKYFDEIGLTATGKKKSKSLNYDFRTNIYNIFERYPLLQRLLKFQFIDI